MAINLKDSSPFLAARYYVSQIPAGVTFAGIGMAIGMQVLTSAWKAWTFRERADGLPDSASTGEVSGAPEPDAKRSEADSWPNRIEGYFAASGKPPTGDD